MLRVVILFATCVLASTFAAAQKPDLNKGQVKVTKVAGNVYKLVGPMPVGDDGNIAACFWRGWNRPGRRGGSCRRPQDSGRIEEHRGLAGAFRHPHALSG
jgi:hypothetical protein